MNNVMISSGASTAVTGAPGVMVPPCGTLDWVNIATKIYHADGLVSNVRTSGDPPGGSAHQPPPLAGVQAAHPRPSGRRGRGIGSRH